jgi:hypothetical protein
MPRVIDATNIADLQNFSTVQVTLIELDWYTKNDVGAWVSTPIKLNTGTTVVEDGANPSYLPLSGIGNIQGIQESSELQAYSITMSLAGIPTELVSSLFADISFRTGYVNRSAKIYAGFLDSNHSLLGTPILLFAGLMEAGSISVEGDTASVHISASSRLVSWERLRGGRFNRFSQRTLYPLDEGFDFVEIIATRDIVLPGGIYNTGYDTWGD